MDKNSYFLNNTLNFYFIIITFNSYFIITTDTHIKKRWEQCHKVYDCFREILGNNGGVTMSAEVVYSLYFNNSYPILTTCNDLSDQWPWCFCKTGLGREGDKRKWKNGDGYREVVKEDICKKYQNYFQTRPTSYWQWRI